MKQLAVVLLVGGMAACGGAPGFDAFGPSSDAIVNGTRTPQNAVLSAGQILAVGYLIGGSDPVFCSGTVVLPRVVVTAQHCVGTRASLNTFFGLGEQPNNPVALLPVSAIHEHPSIDFAILILGRDATVELPGLDPIAMNRQAVDATWLGRAVDAAGFGDTSAPGEPLNPDTGRFFADVEIYDFDAETVSVDGHGLQGICYADSGGPIIWQATSGSRPVVVGTEQWGDSSCVDRDHLSRVDVVAPWVDSILAAGLPPELEVCGSIDYFGVCQKGKAIWCGVGYLRENDCVGIGLECGWLGPIRGNDCLPASCGSTDFYGECNGNVLSRCRSSGLGIRDCADDALTCLWESTSVGFNCGGCPRCGGDCVDLMTSMEHCGGCDAPCARAHATTACEAGACVTKYCDTGYRDADNNPVTGCEALIPPPTPPEDLDGCHCRAGHGVGAWSLGAMIFVARRRRRRF